MSLIEKLDGFTADGFGNVIGTEQDLVDGDVMRITNGRDVSEQRYYAPVPMPPPVPKDLKLDKTEFQDHLSQYNNDLTAALQNWPQG